MLQPSQVNLVWMKNTGDSKWHWAAQCTLALDTPFSLHSSQKSVYNMAYLWAVCESMDPILIAMRLQHHARITRTYESVEHTRNPNIGT